MKALALVHSRHRRVVSMKACARCYMWRPGIDKYIESCVAGCTQCETNQKTKLKALIENLERPAPAWDTIHINFTGPVKRKVLLAVVDAHTQWLEMRLASRIASSAIIKELRNLLARFGVPKKVFFRQESCFDFRKNQNFSFSMNNVNLSH
ncbi:hypothetical protein ANAPC5_01475 [Anaplasma phagocytophilum]|nr:hypothetical protein ANAPC5_01475 [Anaplasma phagocytophilum]